MKIIGSTAKGYLVEATSYELMSVSGDDPKLTSIFNRTRDSALQIGIVIDVVAAWDRLGDLRRREEELRRQSSALRALADLIDGRLEFVTMPPTPAEPAEGATVG